ncbi:MAG TPA: hypothetical protein PKL69_12605 [Agitococcus sp.]|uniref:Uncharacterized protein n=1 Tax=Agitococcus lubricus TaxID=1077255 RepID=A0A2T5IP63_9GAMM|nr:CopG family transcriptional regulator [Agitococcus lubricus]PTQ85612.1 hypothetical protein C8N29_1502 [Agitococcus lubricus]HMY01137.1 hypothetical protein [Agitococcus sp.]HNC04212.1 hypothetical protein [Agitococcus sp.]HNL81169.1 hypothetical protein [Agitococcus sp.]
MAITKPIPKKESVDQFINNAPDGDKLRKGVKKGKREQISLTIPPALLDRLDAVANRLALSRAGMINLAIVRAIEQEEKNN